MPAFSTHYIFAKELSGDIANLDKDIALSHDALFHGTQGPDFFLFGRVLPTMPGKPLFSVSSLLHRMDPAVLFEAMRSSILKLDENRDLAISYAYGFLCHYALDCAMHPYVFRTQETLQQMKHMPYSSSVLHNQIEFNIDMILLEEKLGVRDARTFDTAAILSDDETLLRTMSRVMFDVCIAAGKVVSTKNIKASYKDFKHIQGLLQDKNGWKIPLLTALQIPTYLFVGPAITTIMRHNKPYGDFDYMNRTGSTWTFVEDSNISSTKSVDELYCDARKRAIELIKGFKASLTTPLDMGDVVGHTSFLTGLDARGIQ